MRQESAPPRAAKTAAMVRGLALLLLPLAIVGCSRRRAAHGERQVVSPQVLAGVEPCTPSDELIPYGRGKWRLAAPASLDSVVVWLSHIVIRHESVEIRDPAFSMGWPVQGPPAARTREEALALACRVARLAQANKDRFSNLAHEYSEDQTTARFGGSLGGVPAIQFYPWPQLLDALAGTSPGDISRVIETRYGFHVLLRRAAPPPVDVAGRRLVIGYDDASWLDLTRRPGRPKTSRTRTQALTLAQRLAEQAHTSPRSFSALIELHSEHESALEGGDLGVWSNREPTHLARQIEVLSALGIGEVSDPVDGPLGLEILQRLRPEKREPYAMEAVRLAFDPAAGQGEPSSRDTIGALAREIAADLTREPQRFADYQRQYCCRDVEGWRKGRGPRGFTEILDRLSIGQVAVKPYEFQDGFVIIRRLDPGAFTPPVPAFDLPVPEVPDLKYLVRVLNGTALARAVRHLIPESKGSLPPLGAEAWQRFLAASETLAASLEASRTAEERLSAWDRALAALETALGKQAFEGLLAFIQSRAERAMLSPEYALK